VKKNRTGNYFEEFRLGMKIQHATPRTLTEGDRSLYIGLTGSRSALGTAQTNALRLGFDRRPLEDLLVFNTAFGKTVPDISLNAVANLGYSDVRFMAHVYPCDTLAVDSEIIGLKENSNRKSGVVYVRSRPRLALWRGGGASVEGRSAWRTPAARRLLRRGSRYLYGDRRP
jgi:2-methylfumaryl-CoA hydratase